MKPKPLKIWNGRAVGFKHNGKKVGHFFACAHSTADLIRLMASTGYHWATRREIDIYWSKNCWGTSMDGITPERGVWISYDRQEDGSLIKGVYRIA